MLWSAYALERHDLVAYVGGTAKVHENPRQNTRREPTTPRGSGLRVNVSTLTAGDLRRLSIAWEEWKGNDPSLECTPEKSIDCLGISFWDENTGTNQVSLCSTPILG